VIAFPVMYTPEEVAEVLKVTTRTVYSMLRRGRLPASRVGDLWRISEENLREFLSGVSPAAHQLAKALSFARRAAKAREVVAVLELLEWVVGQNLPPARKREAMQGMRALYLNRVPLAAKKRLEAALKAFLEEGGGGRE
jgi:putative molybdopterin biosynthesis protein